MDTNTSLDLGLTHACGCSQCANDQNDVSTQMLIDQQNSDGSVTYAVGNLDPNANASRILSGYAQGAGDGSAITLEYSFHNAYQSYWSLDSGFQYDTNGMSEFNAAQQSAVRGMLNQIESFTNIDFVETSNSNNADLGFINAQASNGSTTLGGSAYYPTGWEGAGDVFINSDFWGYDGTAEAGDVNYYILLHEIGHTLGLEHTFEAGLSGAENSEQYSVLAYDNSPYGGVYASSYQLYDIYSLQELYGANASYNDDNTNYVLDAGAAYTIWDGGGTDTLDGSAEDSPLTLNLDAGTFSSVGLSNNIAIAYDAVIENANGGSAGDVIYGNSVDNVINGYEGADTLYASAGNDTINGGDGLDSVVYGADITDFNFTFVDANTVEVVDTTGTYGSDTLRYVENFTFNGVDYDYSGLRAEADASIVSTLKTRLFWDGGKTTVWSSAVEDQTFNSNTLDVNGASGSLIRFNRSSDSDYRVTFLQDADFQSMRIDGNEFSNNITINGANENVTINLYAGGGDDDVTVAIGLTQSHLIYGGTGNDTLTTFLGDDRLYGEDGDDTINAGVGNDYLYGGTGDDTLNGEAGNDLIYANEGNDIANGGDGSDEIYGLEGNDTLSGGADSDTLHGGIGNDILNGDAGEDRLYGNEGSDTLNGGAAVDRLYGQDGDDVLNGGDGNDYLYAHDGADTLNGDAGKDFLYGLAGDDRLDGGADNDTLYGGDGSDTLIGGAGKDFLYGDGGADVFGFTSLDGSTDSIQDFTLVGSNADSINITNLLSGFDVGSDDISDFVAVTYKNSGRTDISIDSNGDGSGWSKVAIIKGADFAGLDANDLLNSGLLIVDQSLL